MRRSSFLRKVVPILCIFGGVFLMSVSSGYTFGRKQTLAVSKQLVQEYKDKTEQSHAERLPKPVHIKISWFIDVDIEDSVYQNDTWTISETVASHLIESANPGEKGNIIIYGHNKRKIMGNIRALKGDEKIQVTTADGNIHTYQVQSMHEVKPNETEFLEPTDQEVLTLYTCSGFWDKYRFIVRAGPVKE